MKTIIAVLLLIVSFGAMAEDPLPKQLYEKGTIVGVGPCMIQSQPLFCFYMEMDKKKYVAVGTDLGDRVNIETIFDEDGKVAWSDKPFI